jgi:hypothetical protein
MGSGKGRTRRAQVSTAPAFSGVSSFQRGKWNNFVFSNGLDSITLRQYYLSNASHQITNKDYEVVVSELFADAVTVGAVVLPEPYEVDDFQIEISDAEAHDAYELFGTVSLKSKPKLKKRFRLLSSLDASRQLGETTVAQVIGDVAYGINVLVTGTSFTAAKT